jgi:hypothetical protein
MMPFKACCFTILGLLVLLVSPTCSAFQPVSLPQTKKSLRQRRHQQWSSSRRPSRVMVSLWSRPEVDFLEPSDTQKSGNSIIPPLFAAAIRYHSTVLVASMALLFSTIVEPASIAWAGETTTSATSQSTVVPVQASPKQAELSVLDEVWTKINNYYIDRSFNGQVKK